MTIGLLLALFVFIGCSSNPTSSTLTYTEVDDSNAVADNNPEQASNTSGTPAGYSATPATEPPAKFDEATEELPVYPN